VAFFTATICYPSISISADTIKIGVVGPRTGSAAATGTAFAEGIDLALDYINGKGGLLYRKVRISTGCLTQISDQWIVKFKIL
jgi:ABC-type branched-subunit amino acid transport system substrate-binding protein